MPLIDCFKLFFVVPLGCGGGEEGEWKGVCWWGEREMREMWVGTDRQED